MSTLGELTIAYADHLAEVAAAEPDEDGVMAEEYAELAAGLEATGEAYTAKVDAYLSVADRLEADAVTLAARAKRLEADAERLREMVRASMVRLGLKKHEGVRRATLCPGRERVDVVDLEAVPVVWKVEPAPLPTADTWPVDKRAALAALRTGREIPGLTLAHGEPYLKVSK